MALHANLDDWIARDAISFNDFDWLVVLGTTMYPRGAQPLTDWGAG